MSGLYLAALGLSGMNEGRQRRGSDQLECRQWSCGVCSAPPLSPGLPSVQGWATRERVRVCHRRESDRHGPCQGGMCMSGCQAVDQGSQDSSQARTPFSESH